MEENQKESIVSHFRKVIGAVASDADGWIDFEDLVEPFTYVFSEAAFDVNEDELRSIMETLLETKQAENGTRFVRLKNAESMRDVMDWPAGLEPWEMPTNVVSPAEDYARGDLVSDGKPGAPFAGDDMLVGEYNEQAFANADGEELLQTVAECADQAIAAQMASEARSVSEPQLQRASAAPARAASAASAIAAPQTVRTAAYDEVGTRRPDADSVQQEECRLMAVKGAELAPTATELQSDAAAMSVSEKQVSKAGSDTSEELTETSISSQEASQSNLCLTKPTVIYGPPLFADQDLPAIPDSEKATLLPAICTVLRACAEEGGWTHIAKMSRQLSEAGIHYAHDWKYPNIESFLSQFPELDVRGHWFPGISAPIWYVAIRGEAGAFSPKERALTDEEKTALWPQVNAVISGLADADGWVDLGALSVPLRERGVDYRDYSFPQLKLLVEQFAGRLEMENRAPAPGKGTVRSVRIKAKASWDEGWQTKFQSLPISLTKAQRASLLAKIKASLQDLQNGADRWADTWHSGTRLEVCSIGYTKGAFLRPGEVLRRCGNTLKRRKKSSEEPDARSERTPDEELDAKSERTPDEELDTKSERAPDEELDAKSERTPDEELDAKSERTPDEELDTKSERTPDEELDTKSERTPDEETDAKSERTPDEETDAKSERTPDEELDAKSERARGEEMPCASTEAASAEAVIELTEAHKIALLPNIQTAICRVLGDAYTWVRVTSLEPKLIEAGVDYCAYGFTKPESFLQQFKGELELECRKVTAGKAKEWLVRMENEEAARALMGFPTLPSNVDNPGVLTKQQKSALLPRIQIVMQALSGNTTNWVSLSEVTVSLMDHGVHHKTYGFSKAGTFIKQFDAMVEVKKKSGKKGGGPVVRLKMIPNNILTGPVSSTPTASASNLPSDAARPASAPAGGDTIVSVPDMPDVPGNAVRPIASVSSKATAPAPAPASKAAQPSSAKKVIVSKEPSEELAFAEWAFVMPDKYEKLANLALPEKWYFGDQCPTEGPKLPVLRNYLSYTFRRLAFENKVLIRRAIIDGVEKEYAAFNTGLVDVKYEYIYALLFPDQDRKHPYWRLKDFVVPGEDEGKTLVSAFNPLPQRADYFEGKIENMVYDPTSGDLQCDYTHIILERTWRLPTEMLERCCPPDMLVWRGKTLQEAYARLPSPAGHAYYKELAQRIQQDASVLYRLKSELKAAIDLALKRVEWDHRTAIPVYYPKRRECSMLLPLAVSNPNVVDVALVVKRLPSGAYQGETILPLETAYLNCRLVMRPDCDWLRLDAVAPSSIGKDTEDDEDVEEAVHLESAAEEEAVQMQPVAEEEVPPAAEEEAVQMQLTAGGDIPTQAL